MTIRNLVVFGYLLLRVGAPLAAQAPVRPEGDEWLRKPVDDATFRTFLSFFAYDQKLPLDTRVTRSEEIEGVRVELLSFQSSAGVRVTARLNHTPGETTGGPGVVLVHGGSGAGKDTPGYRALAEFFARAGFTTLAIDLQYFGARKTDLLTTFTETEKHERLYNQPSAYLAWVTQTVKDAGRGYDLLVEHGVDPKRIALVGFSRGAQLAYIVGAAEQRFATVVAMMGGHFDANETGHLPAACAANYIGRISPRPLLMVNGTLDADYPAEIAVTPLERLARQPKKILWREIPHQLPQEETRVAVAQWLREHLR
jgi:dienelactone hydrolase